MFSVISYDIKDDKRRNKVSNLLENYATRVQYSVFEAIIEEEKLKEIIETSTRLIKLDEDSLRIYQLCENCLKKIKIYGVGEVSKDEDFYIV